ncbi:hypothetical protein NIIDMKKI_52930 [Mycobacterium kansasii]|uniref:Uncharacterized protein n=1 Tax=Mycobacterium kansasii TaxID=1768 RepID=A0A7G1IGX9_MYCKA|nr:hypothetical protein NIIDMKKI_52930 [Mycobacterium kansasii]
MVNQPGNDFDDESSTLDLFGRPRRTGPLGTGGNVPVAPNAGILNRNTASSPTEGVELQRFTVTNPDKSVSVSALLDGRIDRVTVSRRAARMTESGLSDEIMTLAQVAMQKPAPPYTYAYSTAWAKWAAGTRTMTTCCTD